MKLSARFSFSGAALLSILALTATLPASATHQIGYSCENRCVVVVDPSTRKANVVDCCNGFVVSKRIRHDRVFRIFDELIRD